MKRARSQGASRSGARRRRIDGDRLADELLLEPGIERAALEPLLELPSGGLLLLEAPAGFGKTHTLMQHYRHARRARHTAAWISLRSAAAAPAVLAAQLSEVLGKSGVRGLSRAVLPEKNLTHAALERFRDGLLEAIARHPGRVLLVLDDYRAIERGASDALLQELLERLPRNLTVALATRRPCPFALSRVLMQGRLQRLDKQVLAFSRTEARAFFGGTLRAAPFDRVFGLTGGWPAALEMARVCLPVWRDAEADLHDVPAYSRLIGDYVAAEVLQNVPADAVELLIECAVTEFLEPGLCDAIRGRTDSAALLALLTTGETFLEPVDLSVDRWRLPCLLQRVLARRAAQRGPHFLLTAHARAAEHFESTQRLLPALRHYLHAQQPAAAAAALERASPLAITIMKGDHYGQELLDLIPAEQLQAFPRLGLCKVMLDFKRGLLDEARLLMSELGSRTENFSRDRPGGDGAKLQLESFCVRLIMEFYGRSQAPTEYLRNIEREQLALAGNTDSRLATLVHLIEGMLYALRGDLDAAQMHFIQCEKLNTREQSAWTAVWLKYHNALIALVRGRLTEARYGLQAGLKLWSAHFPSYPSYRAMAQLALAELDYEGDAHRAAQRRLDESLYTAEHVEGWFEPYATLYEIQMMLYWHSQRLDKIEGLLANSVMVRRVGALLERFVHTLRLRFELLRGRWEAAQLIVETHRLEEIWSSDTYQEEFTYREWDILGACLCRLALGKALLPAAEALAARLQRCAGLAGRSRTVARALALRSAIAHRRGDPEQALTLLLSALEMGYAEGYCRVFLDEGVLIRPVLEALTASPGEIPAHLRAYADRLCAALQSENQAEPADKACPLSEREHEVLRELSQGHSNKLIARKLGVSTPTVNFHVRNVFQKLGVHRRASATAEAHRRGWLS